MYKLWNEESVANCYICFNDTLELELYKVIILSVHVSGTAKTAVSFLV